jgi:hypothetical protein
LTVFRSASRLQLLIVALAVALVLPAAAQATPTFLSGINISDAGRDGFEPEVVVAGDGTVIAIWTRSDGTNFRIQSANRTATGAWSAAQTISDPGVSASGPSLAVDPAGNALAVWTQTDGTNLRITSAFRPAGGSFGAPVLVSAAGQDASAPDVSMDSTGDGLIGWQRTDGVKLRVQTVVRTPGAGGGFGPISTLSAPDQDAFEPKVAAGPDVDANGVAVWTRSDGTNLRVQSARRTDVVGFPRPKGASPTRVSLVPAFNQCTSGNRSHGAPLSYGSCNPPVQSSSLLTIGSPDANAAGANFSGFARFIVVVGNAATEADEADVKVVVSATDVRNRPALTDYAGSVSMRTFLTITDQLNAEEVPATGTTQAIPYQATVPCTTTPTITTSGSTCNLNTTADALVPGTVVENRRMNWQLGQIEVRDAGVNTVPGDGDDNAFLRQGVFVP